MDLLISLVMVLRDGVVRLLGCPVEAKMAAEKTLFTLCWRGVNVVVTFL